MNVLSLFSGIGAFEKALSDLNISYTLINYCENNKHASKSYSAIHGVSESLNLWDIEKVDFKSISFDIDFLTHGSPCQSFSKEGKNDGADKGSNTKSSLLWYSVEAIKILKPKYVLWENVENVTSKKHIHNFNNYLNELQEIGYTNYHKILNAKDFGVPQNRARSFVVSIRNDINKTFTFPNKIPLTKTIFDFLDENVPTTYDVPSDFPCIDGYYHIRQATKKGYIEIKEGIFDWNYPNSKTRRGRVQGNGMICPTLTATKANLILINNGRFRNLTAREQFKLMGFTETDYQLAKDAGVSESQLYKQSGNSIVVDVLKAIYKNLFTS